MSDSDKSRASNMPTDPITQRLELCYTGIIHDIMREMGYSNFTLPAEIAPMVPGTKLAGPVFTVRGRVDKGASAHDTLLGWTGLLSKAKPGHVWLDQPNDDEVAHMGELSAETLRYKGVRGFISDGKVRDVEFMLKLGFPVWSRGYTPRDIVSHWLPDAFDEPIVIGPVTVNPGDYVLADLDGIILIPADRITEILDKAETAINTENTMREAILGGMDPQEAYLKYGKF